MEGTVHKNVLCTVHKNVLQHARSRNVMHIYIFIDTLIFTCLMHMEFYATMLFGKAQYLKLY
jgi:hypothetical protein